MYYGIHALEMAYAVLGRGAVSCLNVGQPGRNIVRVRFENGRDLLLMVAEKEWMRAGYQINLYGTKGWRTLTPNLADLYWYLLDSFLDAGAHEEGERADRGGSRSHRRAGGRQTLAGRETRSDGGGSVALMSGRKRGLPAEPAASRTLFGL